MNAGLTHGLVILKPEISPNPEFGCQIRQKEAKMYIVQTIG